MQTYGLRIYITNSQNKFNSKLLKKKPQRLTTKSTLFQLIKTEFVNIFT